jgi:hypothetical protein
MKKRTPWKFALVPVLAIVILAMYPQIVLWVEQGSDWKGSFFVSNDDEVAYAAYINSLLEGKPRKNDPFLATQDSPGHPHSESLYSIQFIPAYSIALPARLLGLSSLSTFIILMFLIAIAATLAIFKLLYDITSDGPLAAAGVLTVLCFGAVAGFDGEVKMWLHNQILVDFFPFLRRYQPGFAFPIFFVFCGAVWRSLTDDDAKKRIIYSVASGVVFAILVFSYFYLWTAAAAWFACLALIYLVLRKTSRPDVLKTAGIIAAIGIPVLIPYAIMLSRRSVNLDNVQLLRNSHAPDFAWTSLIIGVIVAAAIIACIKTGIAGLTHRTLFALSFALAPILLFNQQVITGHSLQPVHYELFISNYIVLVAFVLLLSLIFRHLAKGAERPSFRWALLLLAMFATGWGTWEAVGSSDRKIEFSVLRDETVNPIEYIKEQTAGAEGPIVVYSNNFVATGFVSTIAPFRALWNPHTSSASGVTIAENKRLFMLYMYYSGYEEGGVVKALRGGLFEAKAALFGSERALPALGNDKRPITDEEILAEGRAYKEFANNFSREHASNPTLSYILFPLGGEPDYTHIDKWYKREDPKIVGPYKIFKVTLKP